MDDRLLCSRGASVILLNCEINRKCIFAGLVYTDPGSPPEVELFDLMGRSAGMVKIPPELRRSPTTSLMHSRGDDLYFERVLPEMTHE